MYENILFKAKFLHLKSWKIIREPLDCTGNEPTLDITIGGSGQDIKKQYDKYMPFVRNMLIIKHLHHLSTEKAGKKTYNMSKCIPIDTNQVNATKIIDGWQVLKGDISSIKQPLPKMQLSKMAELRKSKWNPRCHLVARGFNIMWQHLILF